MQNTCDFSYNNLLMQLSYWFSTKFSYQIVLWILKSKQFSLTSATFCLFSFWCFFIFHSSFLVFCCSFVHILCGMEFCHSFLIALNWYSYLFECFHFATATGFILSFLFLHRAHHIIVRSEFVLLLLLGTLYFFFFLLLLCFVLFLLLS